MQSARGFEYGVIHVLAPSSQPLIKLLEAFRPKAFKESQEWLDFGCVYVNQQRTLEDRTLAPGDHVRMHTRPRRFLLEPIDWNSRIIFENEHLLVLNKPAGVPCHPTVDNWSENICHQLQNFRQQKIYLTHRLDVPTHGLLLFAKSLQAQSELNAAFSQRKVQKIYEAWTEPCDLVPGEQIHWMIRSPRAPKILASEKVLDSDECRLKILVNEKSLDRSQITLALLTGRTHQIRAQLSFLGAPILGDTQYGGKPSDSREDSIALWCKNLEIPEGPWGQPMNFNISVTKEN